MFFSDLGAFYLVLSPISFELLNMYLLNIRYDDELFRDLVTKIS